MHRLYDIQNLCISLYQLQRQSGEMSIRLQGAFDIDAQLPLENVQPCMDPCKRPTFVDTQFLQFLDRLKLHFGLQKSVFNKG